MNIAGLGSPYWYEWEIGLLECLKMMRDVTIKSVVLQSSDFISLDDVVVNNNDGSIVNIQVKHTDCEDNFTYSSLTSGKTPMIKKWTTEWHKKKSNYNIREIRIVTNRKWGAAKSEERCSFNDFIIDVFPILKTNYNYIGEDDSKKLAIEWFKKQISYLGDEASEFVKILSFVQEGDLESVNLKIRENVASILGTDRKEALNNATNSLLAKLETWSTSKRKRQEIFSEDIYKALCVSPTNLPKYELYPEKPIFPSRETFGQLFVSTLKTSNKKMYFFQGLPGSGKTNFVSYLAQLEDSIVDFRFYTYLPVNKEHPSFSDDEGFYNGELLWGSILMQLKDKFEKIGKLYELGFPLIYGYLSVTEKRAKVLEYLPLYAKIIGRTCYVFIDGLDHAARSNDARNSFLSQLPLPEDIGEAVKIILVGQPVNDKYPTRLLRNEQIEYISLPVLEEPDIIVLLSNYEIDVPGVDISTLAQSIISVVGNNALNVIFAIYEVKKMQRDYTFDLIISCLQERHLNSQIDRYYEWIVSSIERSVPLLKIELIFAFASQKIPANHIAEICDVKLEEVVFVLKKMYPLVVSDCDKYYTFHNDVRLYFKNVIIHDSNFETLALSIYDKITHADCLGGYKYDILFGLAYELCDKQLLFDLFSTEYIMNSIQYDVSVTKLIQQFQTVSQIMVESGNLENIDKVSLAAATISQYINCAQYFAKEHLLYEDYSDDHITESEKYILDWHKNINEIVYDIYTLLKRKLLSRANKLFAEYLSNSTLVDFLYSDDSDLSFCERSGFICRYFAPHILEHEEVCDSNNYTRFVKGWLDASREFVDLSGIQVTFTFCLCNRDDFIKYIVNVCSADLENNTFDQLCDFLSEHDVSIISLIELCVKGIFSGYNTIELQKIILARRGEILTSEDFDYNTDRIVWFFKMFFCTFPDSTIKKEITESYYEILEKCHIKQGDRGYRVALAQFSLAEREIQLFYYGCNQKTDEQIHDIYETVFFSRKYGSGSCFDCNWHQLRHFLLNVLFNHYKKVDAILLAEICDEIKPLFTWENPQYVTELSDLFYIANAKDSFVEIAERWCGPNGILWDQSYDIIEDISDDIVDLLNEFDLESQSSIIKKRVLFKLFGYVGHKDYSLNGLLECYKLMPLNEDKLLKYGMELLTISDKASSIGDNRMSGDVDTEIFKTAAQLGVPYVNGLFELKNNPTDFLYWRKCLLDSFYNRLSEKEWGDNELIALYSIVNAWINAEIESSENKYDDALEFLYRYNRQIVEKVKGEKLKDKLIELGNCHPTINSESDSYGQVVEHKDSYKDIIEDISINGYDCNAEQKVIATFSNLYDDQVKLLISIGKEIEVATHPDFVSNCVIEYITRRRKYGYRGTGLNQLIKDFNFFFTNADWLRLFDNIVSSISTLDMDGFYSISDDIETLCLYYIISVHPDRLEELFSFKLDMHWNWLSACELISQRLYELSIDTSIETLYDFARFQLGSIKWDS